MIYALAALCLLLFVALSLALRARAALRLELERLHATQTQLQEAMEAQKRAQAAQLGRLERETTKALERAHLPLARDLFESLDGLGRSRALVPTESEELALGLEMVQQSFLEALATHGIVPIDPPPHAPFDPRLHEAISATPSHDAQHTEVQQTLRPGWTHGPDTLRPAMVAVLKPHRVDQQVVLPQDDLLPPAQAEEEVVLDFEDAALSQAEQVVEDATTSSS